MSNPITVDFDAIGFSDLFVNYLAGKKNIGARFPGNPFDLDSSLKVADAATKRSYPREELVRRLVDYNQELGAGEATLHNIDLLKKENTFVVCTGQQPTILTGPLFTVYKAISCMVLARRLTAHAQDRTFIPVFWCASEDHDLEEMNAIQFPGDDGEVCRVKADLVNDGRPAERVPVTDELRHILKTAAKLLPDTEFKDEVAALFQPEPEDTLGTWFNRILIRLFSDHGLVVLEPHLLRDLGTPIIQRELDTWDETSRLLKEAGEKLIKMNFTPAFDGKRKVHCFYLGDQRRARVQYYADFCILGEDRVDRRELPFHLEDNPERFSPDATLRPVMQGAVLPVTTYVAGPGEIAYHAQLKEVFKHFGVPMPVITPRASVTLLDNAVAQLRDKFGLTPAQLFTRTEERENLLEGSARGKELAASLDGHLGELTNHLEAVEKEVAGFEPGVGRVVRKIHGRIHRDLNYLKRRVTSSIDEAAGVSRRQLQKLFLHTLPGDQLQERTFNILYYLAKYGPDLPRGLILNLDVGTEKHVLLALGSFGPLTAADEDETVEGEVEEGGDGEAVAADVTFEVEGSESTDDALEKARLDEGAGDQESGVVGAHEGGNDEANDNPVSAEIAEERRVREGVLFGPDLDAEERGDENEAVDLDDVDEVQEENGVEEGEEDEK
jgi:bacillithiol synthase